LKRLHEVITVRPELVEGQCQSTQGFDKLSPNGFQTLRRRINSPPPNKLTAMTKNHPTALIADDEPLLRERLAGLLQQLWPELEVVALARNGREAVELFDEHQPDIVFLDVHMPGMNGVEAARAIERRALVVFVTAFEQYAVQAFDQGAMDYIVKPIEIERLADTVQRLRERLQAEQPAVPADEVPAAAESSAEASLLERLAQEVQRRSAPQSWLQWIKASSGNTTRLIPVDEVIYLRSDEKYTLVISSGADAVIRKTIRELADELDPTRFVQIHRSVIVNLHQVSHVVRGANETAEVHLRGRSERLPVSRSWLHVFRQM
jgi:DNA-binding LytR/AlgR family response regulator